MDPRTDLADEGAVTIGFDGTYLDICPPSSVYEPSTRT
jgi:hypothetical protein